MSIVLIPNQDRHNQSIPETISIQCSRKRPWNMGLPQIITSIFKWSYSSCTLVVLHINVNMCNKGFLVKQQEPGNSPTLQEKVETLTGFLSAWMMRQGWQNQLATFRRWLWLALWSRWRPCHNSFANFLVFLACESCQMEMLIPLSPYLYGYLGLDRDNKPSNSKGEASISGQGIMAFGGKCSYFPSTKL